MLGTTIISFILVFSGIILAHEFGHFITAKLSGVKVEEFGLGYPPRIFGFKRGETIYSVNWLFIGGFTKMAGEEDPSSPRSLASKSRATRALVLSAGAIVNALLPFVLFSVAYMVPHTIVTGQVVVQDVAAASPAAAAGIMPGDIILSINGHAVQNYSDLARYIEIYLGRNTTIGIQTPQGTDASVQVVSRWKPPAGQGAIGITLEDQLANAVTSKHSENFFRSISLGVTETFQTMVLFKNSIFSLFVGTSSMQLTGPVGIAQLTGEAAQAGISPLLEFAGFLSLSMAIMNLLPLPALDGGHLAFVFLEWVRRGKRISPKTESQVHFIGFMLLIGLAVVVTYQDIVRIVSGGSP
ncbi:MAG: RIP metalloprotease RseP [Dehalococcoidales bacterium]